MLVPVAAKSYHSAASASMEYPHFYYTTLQRERALEPGSTAQLRNRCARRARPLLQIDASCEGMRRRQSTMYLCVHSACCVAAGVSLYTLRVTVHNSRQNIHHLLFSNYWQNMD